MSTLHEKRLKRVEDSKELDPKVKKELKANQHKCIHGNFVQKVFVDKDEALKVFTDNNYKSEYTKPMNDGTKRWLWTIRNKDYKKVGFALGTASIDQKQGNHSHNDIFKSHFDYMEIIPDEIAG